MIKVHTYVHLVSGHDFFYVILDSNMSRRRRNLGTWFIQATLSKEFYLSFIGRPELCIARRLATRSLSKRTNALIKDRCENGDETTFEELRLQLQEEGINVSVSI